MKKFLYLAVLLTFFAGNIFAPKVNAEIQIYEDVGEFVLADETLDYAKNQAKLNGARNIIEQIFVKIQSATEVKNSELIRDEIITESKSFLHIIDVKYKVEQEGEEFLIKAFVTAEVDSEEIKNIIKKFQEEER